MNANSKKSSDVATVCTTAFTFSQIVRTSTPAPVPQELRSFSSTAVNDRGEVVFASDGGVFLRSRGNVKVVAANGMGRREGGSPADGAAGDQLARADTVPGIHDRAQPLGHVRI